MKWAFRFSSVSFWASFWLVPCSIDDHREGRVLAEFDGLVEFIAAEFLVRETGHFVFFVRDKDELRPLHPGPFDMETQNAMIGEGICADDQNGVG